MLKNENNGFYTFTGTMYLKEDTVKKLEEMMKETHFTDINTFILGCIAKNADANAIKNAEQIIESEKWLKRE